MGVIVGNGVEMEMGPLALTQNTVYTGHQHRTLYILDINTEHCIYWTLTQNTVYTGHQHRTLYILDINTEHCIY
jgi:hypothetical protein